MSKFDYITIKEFRESLDRDDKEMHSCIDSGAWKCAQVLAGSIVECMLIDYLATSTNPSRVTKDPLKMDLADAVSICRTELVLTDRTADLCSVVRSYRNLIHPGRMVRLGEQPPDRGSATIALALVQMISDEMAKFRRASVGLTGEQVLSKVQRDANSVNILKHLLNEVNVEQRQRLLLELIPVAHLDALNMEDPFSDFDEDVDRLERAYRMILETSDTTTREKVAAEFVRVLREEDGHSVDRHCAAFFRPTDIEFIQAQHQLMVKEHFIGCLPSVHTPNSLKLIKGIERYLEKQTVSKWLDPIVRTLVSATVKQQTKVLTKNYLLSAFALTGEAIDAAIEARLNDWGDHFKDQKATVELDVIQDLIRDIDAQNIPF